ncbi:hypothetical protein QNH46_06120 [Paenibacillus woosongensis]|uniref:PepSY domain-containing protein n=1 Tax=Paenibacillus woosongensis TaxID=307580 RepID=A0AA95IDC2_9BACL|nr:DUF6612 family protein [Paenibacillus woosongensis]WHX50238.1 hypothetical protein QNH46_06120 [Paenibacillus woosongensis]
MTKFTAVLLGAMLLVNITACGKENEAGSANTPATNAGIHKAGSALAEDPLPTADELITRSSEATKALKSYSMQGNVDQKMTVKQGDQEASNNTKTVMMIDVQQKPFAIYQDLEMDAGEEGETEIKQYITNEGIYILTDDAWVRIPKVVQEGLISRMEQASSLEARLENFKLMNKDVTVIEEGDEYILSADLSGDEYKELAASLIGQAAIDKEEEMAAMLEMLTIKRIKLSNAIDKETYLPTRIDMYLELEMEIEDQFTLWVMSSNGQISNHNALDEIKIPQDVIDSAI